MKNKKALAVKFIAAITLILVIMVIMLLFEKRIGESYMNIVDKTACKSSVNAQRLTTIKNIALPVNIRCPMQRIEIDKKTKEEIKREFAQHYYDVCDEFGQGAINLFGKRETTFCVIRDKISFKKKGLVIDDFAEYLAETEILGKREKYMDFCSGYKTERGKEFFTGEDLKQLKNVPIDTDKEYAIMFVYIKGEEEIREAIKFFFGTSKSHIAMYIGVGMIVTGRVLTATGKGSVIGIPLWIAGEMLTKTKGIWVVLTSIGAAVNYFTNPDIKMEWVSFFLIREFDEEAFKELKCKYLPAGQD